MSFQLTEEQNLIINYTGDQIIEAGAGCGKSSTLIQKALAYPNLKKVYFSFTAATVKDMKEKAYDKGVKNIFITTFHGLAHTKFIKSGEYKLGYNPNVYGISKEFGLKGDIHSNKIVHYAIKWFELFCNSDLEVITDLKYLDTIESDKARKFVENKLEDISKMAFDIWDRMDKKKMDCSHSFYLKKYQLSHPTLNYDLVLCDECLPYHIPIFLADGTSLPIGKIVDEKLQLDVLTYNTETKKQENCKIINWQKNPNNKKMLKIKFKTKLEFGTNPKRNFIVCTEDHKIWANDSWIQAKDLKIGMKCQIETLAHKTQKYKISSKGKNTLSKLLTEKNNNGVMGYNIPEKGIDKIGKNRGGNGKLSESQIFLKERLDKLNLDFKYEGIIKTKNKYNLPFGIKIDLLNEKFKIAIELDGASHRNKNIKEKDERKNKFLLENGYKILRYENLEVFKNIDIIEKEIYNLCLEVDKCENGIDCPVDSYIISIEETETDENYTYDLTVEKNHNFYANGVLVHNCQDLNPVQLDIIKGLNGTKVIVGDSNQQIYSWRGAINALKAFPNYKVFTLTESFRFTQDIADTGLKALSFKENYDSEFDFSKLKLIGRATVTPQTKIKTRAILSRSNISLLEYLFTHLDKFESIYIEGGIESLINTQSGIKMTDLVYLLTGETDKIENFFVKKFSSIEKLQDYYEDLDDMSIDSMLKFVNRYKKGILFQLVKINEKLTEKQFASITFSTLHKSKGTEFDEVEILSNFEQDWFPYSCPTTKKVENPEGQDTSVEMEEFEVKKLKNQMCEELHLAYVGVTRAKYRLFHNWDWLIDSTKEELMEMEKMKQEIQN